VINDDYEVPRFDAPSTKEEGAVSGNATCHTGGMEQDGRILVEVEHSH
jgi:hypothetical protein